MDTEPTSIHAHVLTCSDICLLPSNTSLVRKSVPIVVLYSDENLTLVNWLNKQVLPVLKGKICIK